MDAQAKTAFDSTPARYAKRSVAIRCNDGGDGFIGRAGRLCRALKARFSKREKAWIMSPAKGRKLAVLHAQGWDAGACGGFIPPGSDDPFVRLDLDDPRVRSAITR